MSAIDKEKFIRASETWKRACKELGVKIVTPYRLKLGSVLIDCLAFLPDFGSDKGMIVGAMDLPEISTDDRVF